MTIPAINNTDFYQLANDAVSRGFAIIPLIAGGKAPDTTLAGTINGEAGTGGAARRTRDLNVIRQWSAASPNANVGVCSDDDITILESDNEAQFREIVRSVSREMYGSPRELPDTLTSQAREGRPHWFYSATAKTRAYDGSPSVDGMFEWRRFNQYVVGPGSLHPTGVRYEITRNVPIAEMPDWLVDVITAIKQAHRGEGGAASAHVKVGPAAIVRDALLKTYELDPAKMLADESFRVFVEAGERHYFFQTIAGLLHDGERTEDELADVLKQMRDAYCEAGKGDNEIESIVRWTMRKEPYTTEPALPVSGGTIGGKVINGKREGGKIVVFSDREAYQAAEWSANKRWDIVRARDVKSVRPSWLWKGFLAARQISTFSGEVGIAKSSTVVDLTARMSVQKPWPDGMENTLDPSATLMLAPEESFESTIKPRWIAAGGDPDMLLSVDFDGANGDPILFEHDLEDLYRHIKRAEERFKVKVRSVAFDPLTDFTRKDALSDQQTREVLLKLRNWTSTYDLAALGIMHFNKKNDLLETQRVSGAKAWTSVPRINNVIARSEDGTRYLATLKTNIHIPVSIAFGLESVNVTLDDGLEESFPRLKWDTTKPLILARDLLKPPSKQGQGGGRRQQHDLNSPAAQYVRKMLAGGKRVLAEEMITHLKAFGLTNAAIRVLRNEEGVQSEKQLGVVQPKNEWHIPSPLDGIEEAV